MARTAGSGDTGKRRVARGLLAAAGAAFLLVVSLGAALLLGEAVVRLVAPQQLVLVRPDIWRPVDTLGWEHRAEVDTEVNTGERPVRFVTDERGFRTAPSGPEEAETEILLLGDSYMAALQVEHARSFAGLVERELPRELGREVAVRNAAVGAWDASHYLLRARNVLERRDYDLAVVAVYLGNDLVDERAEAFEPRRPTERHRLRLPREASVDEAIEAVARPLNDALERRSHLFVLAKTTMENLLMRFGLTARYIPEELREDHADAPAWDVTADVLGDLHDLARERGVPTLFVLIPSHYQVEPELMREHARALGVDPSELDLEQPNRLLGERLCRRRLSVVDLLPAFRDAAAGGARLYGEVDPHFSPEGHRAMWGATERAILAALDGRDSGGHVVSSAGDDGSRLPPASLRRTDGGPRCGTETAGE